MILKRKSTIERRCDYMHKGSNLLSLEGYGECVAEYRDDTDQWVISIKPESHACYPKLVKYLFHTLKNMDMTHTIVIGLAAGMPYVLAWKDGEEE